jgi:hypothetical protein
MGKSESTIVGPEPTNSARQTIATGEPYIVGVTIVGVADLLFHRWSNEGVEAKGKAAKGSKAKKTDDLESYVYRNDDGELALPGEYVRQSVIHAAKFQQDPRSPRKSAMDLFKAGVVTLTPLASLGAKDWDYEDRRRVLIQRNAITRCRPAMKAGWSASFEFAVQIPEYIAVEFLNHVLVNAGRLVGVGDFRPTYGRFAVTKFEALVLDA